MIKLNTQNTVHKIVRDNVMNNAYENNINNVSIHVIEDVRANIRAEVFTNCLKHLWINLKNLIKLK